MAQYQAERTLIAYRMAFTPVPEIMDLLTIMSEDHLHR